jgi:hypothetical protein
MSLSEYPQSPATCVVTVALNLYYALSVFIAYITKYYRNQFDINSHVIVPICACDSLTTRWFKYDRDKL